MINGQITVQNARIQVVEMKAKKVVDGKETEETIPLKVLVILDQESGGLQINVPFTPEGFDQFITACQGNKIIPAAFTAPARRWPFTRNGGIRG